MKINIKDKLEERNMTRYELAKRIGVTYPTIDNIYKGTSTSIKFDILELICKELDCSPIDILVFDDKNFQEQQFKRIYSYYSKLCKSSSKNSKSDTE